MVVKSCKQAHLPNSEINLFNYFQYFWLWILQVWHIQGVIPLAQIVSLSGSIGTSLTESCKSEAQHSASWIKDYRIILLNSAKSWSCLQEITTMYRQSFVKINVANSEFQLKVWLPWKFCKLFKPLPISNPAVSVHANTVQVTPKSIFGINTAQFLVLPCKASPQASGNCYIGTVPMQWQTPNPAQHLTPSHLPRGFWFFFRWGRRKQTQVPELPDTHYGSEVSPVSIY